MTELDYVKIEHAGILGKTIEVLMVAEDRVDHAYLIEGSTITPPAGYEFNGVFSITDTRMVLNLRKLR